MPLVQSRYNILARRLFLSLSLVLAFAAALAVFSKNQFQPTANAASESAVTSVGEGDSKAASLHAGESAAAIQWTRSGPRGGVVTAIATSKSSSSIAYAYIRVSGRDGNDRSRHGLFKSTDSGARWVKTAFPSDSALNTVLSLAVDPLNSSIVYAGTFRNGIFKSTDGGSSWSGPFSQPDRDVISLVIDPLTPTTLYASLGGIGVHKSTDGGMNWVSSNTGIGFFSISSLAINPANPNTVYAAGGPAGPGQFAGVFKSTDGGANWSRQSNGLPFVQSVTAITIDPTNTSTLYLATTGGVFKSTDGAANWGSSSTGLPPGARFVSVVVNPVNPSVVIAASFDAAGLYRSADAGATWTLAGADGVRFDSLGIDQTGANVLAGSVGEGVYRSTNGGSSWNQSNDGLPFALVTTLTADPNNYAALYAGTADGVYTSRDRGESWSAAGFNDSGSTVRGLVADPHQAFTLYAALDHIGVVKTTDGGRTWTTVLSANNNPVNTLAIDPSNPQTLYFARFFRLFKTTNGGTTWTQISSNRDFTMLVVDPRNSSVVYAVSNTGLLKSTNGGTTWSVLPFDTTGLTSVHGLTIDAVNPDILYTYASGSANPVRKSTDGGLTWNPASSGLPPTSAGAHRVLSLLTDPVNTSVLYAACNGPAAEGGGVYRSVDGGENWTLYESTLDQVRVLAISPSGNTLYAGADEGIYSSRTPPTSAISFTADVFEVREGAGAATISVTRTDATLPLSITHATAPGSATSGHDYAGANGLLNFASGETTKTFSVPIFDDAADEFDEGVVLTISTIGGTPRLLSRASLVIVDDDPTPVFSISDVSAPEGDFDTTNFVFNVSLSAPSAKTVSVDLSIAGGTASYGIDLFIYGGPNTLVYAPGETIKTVTLVVRSDLDIEPDETFFVNLLNPVNAGFGDSQGQGTILNDDATPTVSLSINDVSVIEGNYGTTDAVFTVTLSGPTAKTVKVDYSTPFIGNGTITFAPGETAKTFTLPITGNTHYSSGTRQREVRLTNPRNSLLADDLGILTIVEDEAPSVITVDDVSVREGDSGTKEAVFTVKLSVPVFDTQVVFNYQTFPETATSTEHLVPPAGHEDYNLTVGVTPILLNGFTTYQVAVPIRGDTRAEGNETFIFRILGASNVAIGDGEARCTIIDDDGSVASSFQFSASEYKAPEGSHEMTAAVVRAGDLSTPATVNYATRPIAGARSASERSDYTTAIGMLRFAPGEESKTLRVLLTDDFFAERDPSLGDESFEVALSDPTGGAVLVAPQTAKITIIENDSLNGIANPIDETTYFVRQHYHDFLNREPDAAGLQFWSNGITSCGADAQCREVRRINTSAAFFLSIEFQRTGYQVIRFYRASFNDAPPRPRGFPRYREFLRDSQELGRGVIVGVGNWEQQLQDNETAFARRWADGAEFVAQFPTGMLAAQYVDKLFANSGTVPTQAERDAAIAAFGAGGTEGRAAALLSVTNSASVNDAQFAPAFVLMQYIGYLRREPDAAPDTNFDGYNFWLTKLNQFGGDFRRAEMVKAFISSIEYRRRFGP